MSLLAGFDLVAEFSHGTILHLIRSHVKIGGVSANPPFEITMPVGGSSWSGSAHLVVSGIHLDLNAEDTATLTFDFRTASVEFSSPQRLSVCPLDGTIAVHANISLHAGPQHSHTRSIAFLITGAEIAFSSAADHSISTSLAGKPVTPAQFKTLANQAIAAFVAGPSPNSIQTVPMTFTVVPDEDGSLTPSVVFERLEVHCIPNPSRTKQALALFGILLKANKAHGDHTHKTSTSITAAHDGMCISISPEAFNALVLCPVLAKKLNTTVAKLPTSCGSAAGIDTNGVTLTKFVDTFGHQQINFHGAATKSGFCYEANATFHGVVTISVKDGVLIPHTKIDEPDVSVDLPWYCWLAAAIMGPLTLAIGGTVNAVGQSIADGLAQDAINQLVGSGLPGVGTSGLGPGTVKTAEITPDGLTLQGTVPSPVLTNYNADKELGLSGSVTTISKATVGSGVFHTKIWCMPDAKDYPYTEYSQSQEGTYSLNSQFVQLPLTPSFTLQPEDGPEIPLTGTNGTLEIPGVQCHYPMPLATGGSMVVQTAHIDYQINGTGIRLRNHPEEGVYAVWLNATATGCNGHAIRDDNNKILKPFAHVQFEGSHVDIGGGYAADVQYCASQMSSWIRQKSDQYAIWQKVPVWVEVNYPSPEELIQYVRDLVSLGLPDVDDVLRTIKMAHGNSFFRAMLSPEARQPSLLSGGTAVRAPAGQTRVAG
jgi:hypothetical protein